MIYRCLLYGYILISFIGHSRNSPWCEIDRKSHDGLKLTVCTKMRDDGIGPWDMTGVQIPSDTEVLELRNLSALRLEVNFLNQYTDLKRFLIYYTYFVNETVLQKPREYVNEIVEKLFVDTNILDISICNCSLDDSVQFKFPKEIRKLNLSNNSYSEIDLQEYEHLEILDLSRNSLQSFPKFADPSLSLRYINLTRNPLHNMTVLDIASLCSLKELQLFFSDGFFASPEGRCECDRIAKWSQEVNVTITGVHVNESDLADCSNFTLDEARKKRQNCTNSLSGLAFLIWYLKRYYYRIFTLLLVLSIFCIVAFILYKIGTGTLMEETVSKRRTAEEAVGEEENPEQDARYQIPI